jgi:hypothetical protein
MHSPGKKHFKSGSEAWLIPKQARKRRPKLIFDVKLLTISAVLCKQCKKIYS